MAEKEELVKDNLQRLIARMKEVGYHEHWARLTFEYVSHL